MEMTAHQRCFGVNEDDEPFTFLWTHDDDLDFVFSLSRPINSGDDSPIEYMVLDQIWEPIADFNCQIDNDCIRADVPAALRPYASNSDQIVVRHRCDGDSLRGLIEALQSIFKGKSGLQIDVK